MRLRSAVDDDDDDDDDARFSRIYVSMLILVGLLLLGMSWTIFDKCGV